MYRFLIPLFALALLIGCTPSTPADTYGDGSASSSPAMNEYSSVTLLKGKHRVSLKTSLGTIVVEVDADKAPLAATNFVTHAKDGYYDGLIFHRVIPGFMIQGGDPSGNGTGGESVYGKDFDDEQSGIPLVKGVLAMANRGPHTNGSQFFIVQAEETPWLDGRHTAFGKVVEGLDIVDKIANTPVISTDPRSPEANRPVTPVTMDAEVLQ